MRATVGLAVVVVVLAGCRERRVDAAIAKYRPGVEATVKAVAALAPKVAATPAFAANTVQPPAGKLRIALFGSKVNALMVYADDLANPEEARPIDARTTAANVLSTCVAVMREKRLPTSVRELDEEDIDAIVGPCANPTWVLVVRTRQVVMPKVDRKEMTFTPGWFRGEVLLFELATAKYLGGYTFRSGTEQTEEVRKDKPDFLNDSELLREVFSRAELALREETTKLFPGSL